MIIPKILKKSSSSHSNSHHPHSGSSSSQAHHNTPSHPSSSANTPSHSLTNTPNASQTHLNGSGLNTSDHHHPRRQGSVGHGHSSASAAAAPPAPAFQPYEMVQAQQVVEGLISGSLVVLFTKSNDQASQTLKSLLLSHNIFFQLFEVDTAPDNMGPVVEYYLDERAISQGYPRPYRSASGGSASGSGIGSSSSIGSPASPSASLTASPGPSISSLSSPQGDNRKHGLFHSHHSGGTIFDPQIFIKGTHVGGIDQVVQLEHSGQLARMFEVK